MMTPLSFKQFLLTWAPMSAITATVAPAPGGAATVVQFEGIAVPVVTSVLGLVGVLASRWLALPKERPLGTPSFLVVSLIMMIIVELWIVESQPGWLFAFVVAIGVGFSGYSLIELLGDQIKELIKSAFASAREGFGALFKTTSKGNSDVEP